MKLYDSIFVPDPKGNWEAQHINGGNFEDECIEWKSGPFVVLTIEELKEMWDECREETWQDARPTTKYEKPTRLPGFEEYMASKGLTIK